MRLAQLCQDSCFLHDTNIIVKQGMSQSTGTLTLWQVRAVCTQREPTGRVIIVIVTERREKRREKRKRTRKRRERERRKRTTEERKKKGREKERRDRERERERERDERERPQPPPPPPPPHPHLPPLRVYRFKTRACVEHMRAFCQYTRRRFERTHGDVLNLHTGSFSACQAALHTQHTPRTHNTHHAHTHTTHHTLRTNTSTNTTHNDTAQHTTSTPVQPANSAYAPNLADHTGQSSFRPENIGSGTLKSAPTSCCIRAPFGSVISESDSLTPCAVSQQNNDQCSATIRKSTRQMCPLYNVLLCLSLDGDVQ